MSTIHTDQATVDRWLADGRWVQFAPGVECCESYGTDDHKWQSHHEMLRPPADWKSEPCETCDGYGYGLPHDAKFEGLLRNGGWTDELRRDFEIWVADESVPCHFCNGSGVPRLAVTVPCHYTAPHLDPSDHGNRWGIFGKSVCPKCFGSNDGHITVAWATVEWTGPMLPVDGQWARGGTIEVVA